MYVKFRTNGFLCLLVILLIESMTSCNSTSLMSKKDAEFVSMFPEIRMGKHLRLAAFSYNGLTPPETREDYVNIAMLNISNQQIIIPPDLPHKNYIYDETKGEWIQLPEKTVYGNRTTITLYPETDLDKQQFSDWAETVRPDLTGYTRPITIRILVLGEIAQNGESTGQKVGSYIDITFK